jgi:chaperone required for assembly of F1-ATPase
MRERLDNHQTDGPVEAARRVVPPALRRRFYKTVTIATGKPGQSDQGTHTVCLDGKPIRTPGRRVLAAPVEELARALADEWAAQGEFIEPGKMPLTRLANTIIDGVGAARDAVAAEIRKYLASDLVFYRAKRNTGIRFCPGPARRWAPIFGLPLALSMSNSRPRRWSGPTPRYCTIRGVSARCMR